MSAAKKAIKINIKDEDDSSDNLLTIGKGGKARSKKTGQHKIIKKSKPAKKAKPVVKKSLKTVAPKRVARSGAKKKVSIVDEDREVKIKQKREDLLAGRSDAVKEVVGSSLKEDQDEKIKTIMSGQAGSRRPVKLYRKIALSFIALTIILLVVIFYFSLVKVTIVLIPNQERISNNMIIDIYDQAKEGSIAGNAIKGIVKEVKIEHTNVYLATEEEVIGEEAVGKVEIINNYIKNQPLVATTRLLTPDNKLFRISETVNIPAGGSVEVGIYADEPSQEMAIGPTKFTIPGLWAGLQEKIYAESKEDIVYQQKVEKYIAEDDLDNSIRDLKQLLLTKAKSEINETYKDYSQIIYKINENSIESEVFGEAGEKKDEFSAFMEAEVVVVAFNDQPAVALAKQKFVSSLADNKELLSFDENNIIYDLNNFNSSEGAATINATFEGKVTLKEDSSVVEIDKILGLNKQQLDTYLSGLPELAGFEVKFFPSFIKKVPRLVDRIEIELKK